MDTRTPIFVGIDVSKAYLDTATRPDGSKQDQARATLRGHADNVRSLIFLGGGSKLLSRSEDGAVKVWDLLDHNRDRQWVGSSAALTPPL